MARQDDDAAAYYEDPENRQLRGEARKLLGVTLTAGQFREVAQAAGAYGISVNAYLRVAGLALAASHRAGGTASCGHLSVSPVTSAECQFCGSLPVAYTVR